MAYSTLLICQVKTIDPGTLNKILEYIRKGLNVVFIGEKPSLSPGFKDYEQRDKEVKKLIDRIFETGANYIEYPEHETIGPYQGLSDWTKRMVEECGIEKGISIQPNDVSVFYNHRICQDTNVIFLVNSDRDRTIELNLNVNIPDKKIWRWCPESLNREILSDNSSENLLLKLSPLESALLIIDSEGSVIDQNKYLNITKEEFGLNGNWEVECKHHITHAEFSTELSDLSDLAKIDSLRDFCGEISYRLNFDLQDTTFTSIDPGKVYDIAEVFLNGIHLGTRWWGKLPLNIPDNLLKNKGNTLIIKVYNRLFNYCASLTDNPVAGRWVEMNGDKTKLPTGLLGPVRLS